MNKKNTELTLKIVSIVAIVIVLVVIIWALIFCQVNKSKAYQEGFTDGYNKKSGEFSLLEQENKGLNSSLKECQLNLTKCEQKPITNYTSENYPLLFGNFSLNYSEVYNIFEMYCWSLVLLIPLSFSILKINIKIEGRVVLWILFIIALILPLIFILGYGN
jgi:hypothetical protein